ncbi:hypothetical protein [Aliivibrio fischeri]|uniref:hypothetical protein n=1 Tax=Aliivibrio fischeri TaxID=668 RepID=UPI00064C1F52|nr:hypothetical protein [Aliivibrio fischeri]KLU80687.1 hypothetical protein AB192_02350 [Aliivibrio fischeri]MCE7536352.1 hypothetical protein [Aliivibrio fischeri]MCE7559138.1 hypothetical protein [Aliivibrio fischeri]MCE7578555.1 hypothetical protein [Aliivibrio fischeri]MCE7590136.1 hypothetical protein [Aliivibrio fischeri]
MKNNNSTYKRTMIRRKSGKIVSKKTLIKKIPLEKPRLSDLDNILALLEKIDSEESFLKIKFKIEQLERQNINPLKRVRLNSL